MLKYLDLSDFLLIFALDLKFSKKRATLEFPWIDLMWGLNVKDEDGEE